MNLQEERGRLHGRRSGGVGSGEESRLGSEFLVTTSVLGGSWDLVSMVISTLSADISSYKYSYLNYNPSY